MTPVIVAPAALAKLRLEIRTRPHWMSAKSDEARRMAAKYRVLAETGEPADRRRFGRMADWWLKRAAELDAAEKT